MPDFIIYIVIFIAGYLFCCGLRYFRYKRREKKLGAKIPDVRSAMEQIRQAARQDSFFNMVLDYIPCQVFIKDPLDGYRYKIANKNFTDYYQLCEEDVVEHPDEDIFEPDVAQQLRCHDREVCSNPGKVFRYDEDISYRRCGKEVFKSLKVCFETPDHHPYMLGVCVDITDMDNMIRMERINNTALSQAVAESDFRKVVESGAKTLKNELNCSRVIFLKNIEAGKLKLFHEEYASDLKSISVYGLENHEKMWNAHWDRFKSNRLIIYENLREIPETQEFFQMFPNYATRSVAAVPICIDKEFIGALMISYRIPHVFRETDKDLLWTMSKIVSLAAIRDRQSRCMRQAEEENQALLDNISIPLWLFDESGCVIQTNRAADEILGKIDNEIPFRCRDLLGCEKQEEYCPVRQVFKQKKSIRVRSICKGRSYQVEFRPIMDNQSGDIRGVVSSHYDVTELEASISCRQSVNDCLTNMVRENDMSQAINKSIRDICEHLKATRCYIMQFDTVSETVSCFLEYTHNESPVLNQIHRQPYSSDARWEQCFMEHPLLSFPNRESLDSNEGLAIYRDRFEQYNVQSVYAHRILLHGKLWGYVSALYEHKPHELTEAENDYIGSIAYCIELMLIRMEYQSKILEALRKAEDADKAKSMFLASMSHEIRTPLNAVIGFSELLRGGNLPKQTETDYLGAISRAGNALLALINDVLDLSKLETGQMEFSPVQVDFPQLVNEVGNIFQQKYTEKGLGFRTEFAGEMPSVFIDKLRVRQILFNLIGNAVKFTDQGVISVKAVFRKNDAKVGVLEFTVADTGIGISEDDQKRIFQIFIQGKALRGTQTERNGTGLGLAICKNMIEKMNGKLSVKSVPGQGSEFIVVLKDVSWVEDHNVMTDTPVKVESAKAYGPITFLAVDDVPLNLKVMKAMLLKLGNEVNVLTAGNADEAWKILTEHAVDYIMTDLWMPGLNGAELAARVRQSGKFSDIIIAAVTADVNGKENFDMSFFDMVMTKPITVDKLKHFMEKFNRSSKK